MTSTLNFPHTFHNLWVMYWFLLHNLIKNHHRIFLIFGILGNVAICLVIVRNEFMRTITNIYLFFNLALTDFTTLLFAMPCGLLLMWRQYPWIFEEVSKSKHFSYCIPCIACFFSLLMNFLAFTACMWLSMKL